MDERVYYLSFSVFNGIGPKRLSDILKHYKTAKNAYEDNLSNYKECHIPEKIYVQFQKFKKSFNQEAYLSNLTKKSVDFIALCDKDYPIKLHQLKNSPVVLFTKGNKDLLSGKYKKIAVVGTRKMTVYGKQVTEKLTSELCNVLTIVSGLALGVDATAHKTTLDNNGKTIAVLGCGVDVCFPSSNRYIYDKIIETGLVISEYPVGEKPNKGTFPARNRIIAGLSDLVLVTEAGVDSGALITAEIANKIGRKVFAVPGPITSKTSDGTSILIKNGASLCTASSDIFDYFKLKPFPKKTFNINLIDEEKKIVEILGSGEAEINDIAHKTGIKISRLSTLISVLEIKGVVKNLGSGNFCLKNKTD